MRRRSAIFWLAIAAVVALTAPVSAQDTWKIGALYPLTGNLAVLGNENLNGAQIAVEVVNEQGGINGRKVELVSGDASTPEKAQSEAERLISLVGLKVITGTYSSGLSYASSQVAERHGALYWETGGIADTLTKRGFKYFFRVVFTATSNGELAATISKDVIASKLGTAPKDLKLLVVHEDSDYGTSVATAAEGKARSLGFNVVDRLSYKSSSTDLSPLVLKMKSMAPDIVITSSYATDALLIQREMKQLGVNVKAFIGTGGIYGLASFAEGVGSGVNGIFDTEGSANVGTGELLADAKAQGEIFRTRFEAKYGKAPSYVAAQGFVGTYVFLKYVLQPANTLDPDKLREVALKVDIPPGGTMLGWGVKFAGPDDAMAGTNMRAFPVAQQWQNGKLVVVVPASVKTGDAVMIPLPTWDKR